ncbi:MAG: metal-sulfur cluster assembly factor, partial [Limnohabitans sp.]
MSPNATSSRSPDEARAWGLLETLTDPEIPVVTLRELGILRDVRTGAAGLEIVITPTYSGCPAMGQIEDDVHALLKQHGLQG